jgi:hypothetical protein
MLAQPFSVPAERSKARDRVFIIRIFTGSIIGMISGVLISIFVLVLIFAGVLVALAATGGPGTCTPGGGPTTIDAANAASFRGKWDAFSTVLDGGAPANATFNESEISSRADEYLKQKDAPLKNPHVCLHNGQGEATATFSFLGFSAKLKLTGTMQLTGKHPQAKIDKIEIGNIPSFLTSPAERFVNSALDDVLNGVNLDHKYAPTLTDGQAAVAGTP